MLVAALGHPGPVAADGRYGSGPAMTVGEGYYYSKLALEKKFGSVASLRRRCARLDASTINCRTSFRKGQYRYRGRTRVWYVYAGGYVEWHFKLRLRRDCPGSDQKGCEKLVVER